MTERKNKTVYLLLAGMIFLVACLWLSLRLVEVIAVHQDDNYSDVLVKNFPFTAKGKIKWWFKNNEMLKSRYGILKPDPDGAFTINFWLFGDGYKEEGKYDRRCFEDMKTEKNCIEKKMLFTVRNNDENIITFITYNGRYIIGEDGKIIKHTLMYE